MTEPGDGSDSGFSFADKRRVDPKDGSVRPSGPAAGEDATAPQPSDPQQPMQDADPIDAEAAELFDAARSGEETPAPEGATGGESARVAELESQVASLSEELKRSQAEYVNSRRRIEAGALASTEAAVGRVLSSLVSVLDDVELGRQHGDITEGTPFHAIAGKLEDVLRNHGMERFGAVGEEFDPTIHEALMHEDSDEVEVNTIKTVLQPGYRVRDKVVRPARVATYGPQ